MIGLTRVVLFILGTLAVIVGAVLVILGGLALLGGFIGTALAQLVPGVVLLLLGTIGTTKLDRRLKAARDRRRTVAAQTREFT